MAFAEFHALFPGDAATVRSLLTTLAQVIRADLAQWDTASATGDWMQIRRLAHKLKAGAYLIGEEGLGDTLNALEGRLNGAEPLVHRNEAARARGEVCEVLARIEAFVADDRPI